MNQKYLISLFLISSALLFSDCYNAASAKPIESTTEDPDDATPLLDDHLELEQYLAAFPIEEYKQYEIPGQGVFYAEEIVDYIKNEYIQRCITWEPYIQDLLNQHIKPGSTVFDIGAHIGLHTVSMAKFTGAEGTVLAFEPQRKVFRELFWNCRENNVLENVSLFRIALGNTHGIVQMSKSVEGNEGGTPIGNGGDLVELRTVDSFHASNVSLMKIDVEGFEDEVLFGARKTIAANRPIIVIELMGGYIYESAPEWVRNRVDKSKKILNEMGYTVYPILPSVYDYLAIPDQG